MRINKLKQNKLHANKHLFVYSANSSQHIIVAEGAPPFFRHRPRSPLYTTFNGQDICTTLSGRALQSIEVNRIPGHYESTLYHNGNKVLIYAAKHIRETRYLRGQPVKVIHSQGLALGHQQAQTSNGLSVAHIQGMQLRQVSFKFTLKMP
jgi:hypothetical protein